MKAIDFLNKFIDPKIPPLARSIAQQAVKELNEGNETPLEVTELQFYLMAKFGNITPNETHGIKWFRIFDEQKNSKDIQIQNPWKR
jgi:hypothetical protein